MTNCTTAKCTSLFARYRVPTVYPFRIFAEVKRTSIAANALLGINQGQALDFGENTERIDSRDRVASKQMKCTSLWYNSSWHCSPEGGQRLLP